MERTTKRIILASLMTLCASPFLAQENVLWYDKPLMQTYDIPAPKVSDPSKLVHVKLNPTYLYDIETKAGQVYSFTAR